MQPRTTPSAATCCVSTGRARTFNSCKQFRDLKHFKKKNFSVVKVFTKKCPKCRPRGEKMEVQSLQLHVRARVLLGLSGPWNSRHELL